MSKAELLNRIKEVFKPTSKECYLFISGNRFRYMDPNREVDTIARPEAKELIRGGDVKIIYFYSPELFKKEGDKFLFKGQLPDYLTGCDVTTLPVDEGRAEAVIQYIAAIMNKEPAPPVWVTEPGNGKPGVVYLHEDATRRF